MPDMHEPHGGTDDATPRTRAAQDRAADAPPVDRLLDDHRARLQTHFPIPPARPAAAQGLRTRKTALGALLAVALAGGLWWADPAYRTQTLSTRIGEQTRTALADGSVLTLDTGTTVRLAWRLRSRHATLEQGRAHFDVSPSARRPFTVDSQAWRIRVVGTSFDVWRTPDATEVAVYQGQVAVHHGGQEDDAAATVLQAGQRIALPAAGHAAAVAETPARPFDTQQTGSWQQGRLLFRNTPLREARDAIQRYRDTPIMLADDATGELRLSGVFETSNTDQLLALLPGILPVQIVQLPGGGVIIQAR